MVVVGIVVNLCWEGKRMVMSVRIMSFVFNVSVMCWVDGFVKKVFFFMRVLYFGGLFLWVIDVYLYVMFYFFK